MKLFILYTYTNLNSNIHIITVRTLAIHQSVVWKWTAEQPPREQCYTSSRAAHPIANTKHPCKRQTVQEKQHALRYKQQFMANGWHDRGNSDSRAAMHKVLGHLLVFIPFHKFVQQNWPCSVFIVVAEVETYCPAELQHIAPLVFVYHFIFRLL